jgi:hypothetical protein
METVFIVRPNLGQPLILHPSNLKSFEISVAGKTPVKDYPTFEKPKCPKPEEVVDYLKNLQIMWSKGQNSLVIPLKVLKWVMKPILYVDLQPGIWIFNNDLPKENGQKPPVPFPQSAMEHQHLAGFRWEGKLKVGIDMPDSWEPAGGWPAMCDIKLNKNINFHAVYVTEALPNSNDLKFIHLTDTHIARRNDLIPKEICKHLKPWQQKIFLAKYRNPNDHLRAIIRYVNAMSTEEKPNFIVLTGDIVDYFHDGYFQGNIYHYGYGRSAPTVPSPNTSNFRNFIDIITGQEENGEALTIPIFIVPGNHDYLQYEHLLAFNLDPELEPTNLIKFLRSLIGILSLIPGINILANIIVGSLGVTGVLPLELWHLPTSARFDEELDRYRGFNLKKSEALLFDLYKKGDTEKYRLVSEEYKKNWYSENWPSNYEETLSLQQTGRFVIPEHGHFFQYLTEISYDTDFSFSIGDHQFVCLNTGQTVEIPSADELIESQGDPTELNRGKARFLEDASWNRGFIQQHDDILKTAQQRAGRRGLVFLFTHAPLINLHPKDIPEIDFMGKVFDTNDLNQGLIDNELDYDIARNSFQMVGKDGKGFTMAFAGHFHGNIEYQVEIGKSLNPKYSLSVWCLWGWYSKRSHELSEWQKIASPLFFHGGSQKSDHPMVREVHMENDCIIRAPLNKYVPRLSQAFVAGPMTSFLTAMVSQFAEIAGYKGILITPIDEEFLQYLSKRTKMDRELIIRDMIENFLQMSKCVEDVTALGGYWGRFGDLYGICEERDINFYSYYKDWGRETEEFLKMRNRMPEDITDEEKRREEYMSILGKIHEEIDFYLKKISGWVKEDGKLFVPEWYKNWKIEPPRYLPFCRIQLLLLANIIVWLNRFGLNDTNNGTEMWDVEYQFKSLYPFRNDSIFDEIQKRILELFEFANLDDDNPLRLWYTFESTYMAELGGYKVEDRNELNPTVHMKWALSLPKDAIIADIIVKYQLQAEHQMKKSGIEGLKQFYSSSSARLAAWAANGESVRYDEYKNNSLWDDQKILEDLTYRVNSVVNKLINREE